MHMCVELDTFPRFLSSSTIHKVLRMNCTFEIRQPVTHRRFRSGSARRAWCVYLKNRKNTRGLQFPCLHARLPNIGKGLMTRNIEDKSRRQLKFNTLVSTVTSRLYGIRYSLFTRLFTSNTHRITFWVSSIERCQARYFNDEFNFAILQ